MVLGFLATMNIINSHGFRQTLRCQVNQFHAARDNKLGLNQLINIIHYSCKHTTAAVGRSSALKLSS